MAAMTSFDLSHRPIVQAYLKRYPPEVSELTFTNLFVWGASRPIFFAELENSIVFMADANEGRSEKKVVFGPPVGEVSPSVLPSALGGAITGFVRIPEEAAAKLGETDMRVEADRDNSDYVYRVSDLAELAGRQYHKKRNLIKQCLDHYKCEYEPLTGALIAECSNMQDRWCEIRQCGRNPGLCSEYVAVRKTLEHYEEFGLVGGLVRIDGTIQAYAIGEELRPGTAVCHFEKAMPGFRGLGQLINQWFAKYTLREFEFVNREQDLGIAGLRQAKESYYPDHMVDKFSAWLPAAGARKPKPVEPHECHKHGVHAE